MSGQRPQDPPDGSTQRDRLLEGRDVTEHRMTLAGMSTAVLVGGDGPPLILLHGPGHSALWWMRVVPRLVATHRVIVPDLPGHGESSCPSGVLKQQDVLTWLDELIDRTCAVPPVLIGHALGGSIAARYAIEQGEKIQHLVLESSMGLGRFFPSPRFAYHLFRFVSKPDLQRQEAFFDHCMLDQDQVKKGLGEDWAAFAEYYVDKARVPQRKKTLQGLLKEVGIPRIPRGRLAGIRVPVTLIHGRHDRAVRLKVAKAASRELGWPLHVLSAGADPDVEDPEGFLRALGTVLEQMPSGADGAPVRHEVPAVR